MVISFLENIIWYYLFSCTWSFAMSQLLSITTLGISAAPFLVPGLVESIESATYMITFLNHWSILPLQQTGATSWVSHSHTPSAVILKIHIKISESRRCSCPQSSGSILLLLSLSLYGRYVLPLQPPILPTLHPHITTTINEGKGRGNFVRVAII